jgi:hypothetical protein
MLLKVNLQFADPGSRETRHEIVPNGLTAAGASPRFNRRLV